MEVIFQSAIRNWDNATLMKGVMGGLGASSREFPFHVGLTYEDRFYCGGSIISTVFIITAAHCVHNLSPTKFKVTAGDVNRLISEGTEQTREVSHIFAHPDYKRATLDNDIAIMVLTQPFNFNANVGKIKFLKDPGIIPSGMGTVAGWGQLRHGGTSHQTLQKVDVPIIPSTECKQAFESGHFNIALSSDVLCAGGNGKDACKGDSGGGLSARAVSGTELLLVGVVSWGAPCNETDLNSIPGVYTSVSKYSKWIEETMMKYGRESGRCQPEEFYCSYDNVCILSNWVCDGDVDCSMGEDESPGLCSLPCPPTQFQCEGGKCISSRWLCDGRQDCQKGEDEQDCKFCKPGSLKCSMESKCYSDTAKCDGNHDCRNAEDERECSSCHGRGFHCKKNNRCVPWAWKCDGEIDCDSMEDEAKCFCFFRNLS